jgi:hypothetical protein
MAYSRWYNLYHKNKSSTIHHPTRTSKDIYWTYQEHQNTYKFWGKPLQCFTGKDKVSGLKSHDFSNILRFHIPIAIRGLTTPSVREAIYKLSRLIRWISTKSINTNEIEVMKDKLCVVMTLLQMQFPTLLFDGEQH